MKTKTSIFLLILFSLYKLYSQENYGGEPYLSSILNESLVKFENNSNNYFKTREGFLLRTDRIDSYTSKIYFKNDNKKIFEDLDRINIDKRINVYGKALTKEANIVDLKNRIEYNQRYFHIFEIDSENAQSIQVYFKKFKLKEGSELYIYDATGKNYLGAFTQKNNPIVNGEYEFGTQPLIASKIFIELSYPKDGEVPDLVLGKVIHGFKSFYGNGGAFGDSGDCNKNAACKFTGNNDLSRNIKSVGVILLPTSQGGYYGSCSGNLMNNGNQDGTPFFITAQHCIGLVNINNGNWNNEMITLFNYETKKCSDEGSTAPSDISKNSVLGADLLVESNSSFYDFAFLKLRTNKDVLARYGVCYAGWDNNASSYLANTYDLYGVHHPSGDVKKFSLVKSLYPSNKDYSRNSIGNFLAVTWKDGIVEPGSSGSPLFNSFDRYIGNLSTGPSSDIFNCDNSLKYSGFYFTTYSRFSENYYRMRQWLDPNNSSIQSIGPYCPSSTISMGLSSNYNSPPPSYNSNLEYSVDLNRVYVHPSNTFGKKIYTQDNTSTPKIILSNDNIIITKATIDSKIKGVYKISDCNKLEYLNLDDEIKMKNPINPLNQINGEIIGADNNRIIVWVKEISAYNINNIEIQTFIINGKNLVFESWLSLPSFVANASQRSIFYSNNHLMIFDKATNSKILYSWYLSNSNWVYGTPLKFSNFAYDENIDIKIIGEKFLLSEVKGSSGIGGKNKLSVYSFVPNSPNYNLTNTYSNLYKSNNSTGIFKWTIIDISKNRNKNDSYYISYLQSPDNISADTFNRILELDLENNSINHLNLGGDNNLNFSTYGKSYYRSYFINNKIYQFSTNVSSSVTSLKVYTKDTNSDLWSLNQNQVFYHDFIYSINDKYILQHIGKNGSYQNILNIFNLRELEHLFHPSTLDHNNSTLNTAAYNMIKVINKNTYWKGMSFGRDNYTNVVLGNSNVYEYKYHHMGGTVQHGGVSNENKTVILSDYTEEIKKDSNTTIAGTYGVVMKPGFSVSSADNIEFRAITQKDISSANIPACSFTFDDMLNPQLGDLRQQMYSRQNIYDIPYYGKIIYKPYIIENRLKRYRLYPNPTSNIVIIETEEEMNSLKIFSVDGKQIFYKDLIKSKKNEVDLSHYPSGVYFINVYSEKGNVLVNEKVIKK